MAVSADDVARPEGNCIQGWQVGVLLPTRAFQTHTRTHTYTQYPPPSTTHIIHALIHTCTHTTHSIHGLTRAHTTKTQKQHIQVINIHNTQTHVLTAGASTLRLVSGSGTPPAPLSEDETACNLVSPSIHDLHFIRYAQNFFHTMEAGHTHAGPLL